MIKHPDQRVGVFVDTANMYHSAKNLYGDNVNFGEVLRQAVGERSLIRAIAYVIRSAATEESSFFDALGKQGFEIKQKDLQVFSSGSKKADWDVGLTVDAIKMADRLDTVVIVSGDGDFVPLVRYLQENKGCLVEVVAFKQTTSSKLIEEADDFTDLAGIVEEILMRGRGASKPLLRKSKHKDKPARSSSEKPKKRRVIF